MRVLKGRAVTLRHIFLDETEENPLTLTAVSVSLLDSSNAEIANAAATEGPVGEWTVSFPAQSMGVYTVVWDGGEAVDETTVEVVNNHLFSVPQARNSDDFLRDDSAFTAQEIIEYREVVEAEFQRITGRSFTTRVQTREFVADGTSEFVALIPDAQAIVGVTVDGNDIDSSLWQVSRLGKITSPDLVAAGSLVRVTVRYGFPVPPLDVARVGMVRLRSMLAAETSGIPDRATTWQPEEGGTFRLATPGQGKWKTGIPEVDSTLANYTLDTVLAVYAGG